jgi:hypothetical protein
MTSVARLPSSARIGRGRRAVIQLLIMALAQLREGESLTVMKRELEFYIS